MAEAAPGPGPHPEPVASFVVAPLAPSTGDTVRPSFLVRPGASGDRGARVGLRRRHDSARLPTAPLWGGRAIPRCAAGDDVRRPGGCGDAARPRDDARRVDRRWSQAPATAAAGETVPVVVTVASPHYPEMVQNSSCSAAQVGGRTSASTCSRRACRRRKAPSSRSATRSLKATARSARSRSARWRRSWAQPTRPRTTTARPRRPRRSTSRGESARRVRLRAAGVGYQRRGAVIGSVPEPRGQTPPAAVPPHR